MNKDLLEKMQSQVRIGGKGTPRRKHKRIVSKETDSSDIKLADFLKKSNLTTLNDIFEVNMFRDNGKVQVFEKPVIQSNQNLGLYVISGRSNNRELSELVPSILNQLGPDSLASLKKLAETYKKDKSSGNNDEKDDDIPNLVENL